MPHWKTSEHSKNNILITLLIMIVSIIFLYMTFLNFDKNDMVSFFTVLLSSIFLIYISGRLYGEVTANNDFVEITKEGIVYRETPGFGLGWLPYAGKIDFNVIGDVDLIEIQTFLGFERKYNAILIRTKLSGKNIIIGSKLAPEHLMEALLAMKGSVLFSNKINRILGDHPEVGDTLKQVADIAKGLWNRFQERK